MTAEDVLEILEKYVAPVKLSDDFCAKYKMYDNSGIIINCGQKIVGALFSLDFSEAAATLAVERGCNLIITHHPAIYGGVSRLDLKNSPQARAIATCLKNGVSVISMHLNFDAAPEGIDYFLMRGVGGKKAEILADVDGGGYGRVYDILSVGCEEFMQKICTAFSTKRAILHGGDEGQINRVASFCGAGLDDAAIAFAKANNVDAVVSSDIPHHRILELVESGIAVVELTHYSAEAYGFKKIYEKIKDKLNVPSSLYFDGRFA